ncbi:VTT domain-containing protein [Candidatus Peregrinibacteria bacterium]|nr:VTT domain-containing protein [Candidatus Peregrinibacteria bacterium]
MLEHLLTWMTQLADSVSLPVFVIVGGIVEEIVAPIPSPLVNALAGSIAKAQKLGVPFLLWLNLLSAVSKTAGTWIFYVVGDKLEDAVVPRFGKYIGVTHNDLEHFGEHFKGTSKDDIILLILRAIPAMPSTPISLICGILKINMRTFLVSTCAGFYLRNLFFMAIGYSGFAAADALIEGFGTIESVLTIVMVLTGVAFVTWLYWMRGRVHPGTWLRKLYK